MPQLRPTRDINDHEVIPFFAFSGAYPTTKGAPVKIISGFYADQAGPASYGAVGNIWQNTVSNRYGVQAQVGVCATSGDNPIGILLYDARELDENGEKLILHPDKAERMQARPSGWPIPILKRGMVEFSGAWAANAKGGEVAYLSTDGSTITTTGTAGVSTAIGRFLGPMDTNGYIFVNIAL
jgi:hypothetical protein